VDDGGWLGFLPSQLGRPSLLILPSEQPSDGQQPSQQGDNLILVHPAAPTPYAPGSAPSMYDYSGYAASGLRKKYSR
jgi:hypothetical protein